MSVKSQENNMRRLADLLSQDLSCVWGDRESGPNGAKRTFLNLGKVFLRALAKDLGLRDAKITSNPGGIAVSGDCSLIGMWEQGGIYINISQTCVGKNYVLYRPVRNLKDYSSGYNRYLSLNDLRELSYPALLDTFRALNKEGGYERAA